MKLVKVSMVIFLMLQGASVASAGVMEYLGDDLKEQQILGDIYQSDRHLMAPEQLRESLVTGSFTTTPPNAGTALHLSFAGFRAVQEAKASDKKAAAAAASKPKPSSPKKAAPAKKSTPSPKKPAAKK